KDDSEEEAVNLDDLGIEDETEEPLAADIDPQSLEEEVTFEDDVPIEKDDLDLEEAAELLEEDPQALADRMLEQKRPDAEFEDDGFTDEASDVDEVSEDEADAFEEKLAAS